MLKYATALSTTRRNVDSNPKCQNDVIPIDVYAAIQRRFLLDPETIAELRRQSVFSDLTANEAIHAIGRLLDTFGPHLTKQLLLYGKLQLQDLITRVEPRVALIMNASGNLNHSDVLRMMVKESSILYCDDMTFNALLDSAKRLLPEAAQCGYFLFAFPHYFALPPMKVSKFIAADQKTIEERRNDHPALWVALLTFCENITLAQNVRTDAQAEPIALQPATNETMPQTPSAWLGAGSDPLGMALGRPRPQTSQPDRSPPATQPEKLPVQFEINPSHKKFLELFDRLGFNFFQAQAHAKRLRLELGSWKAALNFVETLVRAGWRRKSLSLALSAQAPFRKSGLNRILELHALLVDEFGMKPAAAAHLISHRYHLLGYTAKQLAAIVRNANPDLQPWNVERLLGLPMRSFQRQVKLEAPEPRECAVEHESQFPPVKYGPRDNASTAAQVTAKYFSVPEFASAFEAIKAAGWTKEAAQDHLLTFPGLNRLNPTLVHLTLAQIKTVLGLYGCAFTRLLHANTCALVFNRDAFIAAFEPAAHGIRRTLTDVKGKLAPEQLVEAGRLAVSLHVFDPDPQRIKQVMQDALGILRVIGYKSPEAKARLSEHPELLADSARPLALLNWMIAAYWLEYPQVIRNLQAPYSRMALFLQPDALRQAINERRLLAVDYEDLQIDSDYLDPCIDWSRVFCPLEELAFRLEFLREKGERPTARVVERLHLPSRDAFMRVCREESAGKRRR